MPDAVNSHDFTTLGVGPAPADAGITTFGRAKRRRQRRAGDVHLTAATRASMARSTLTITDTSTSTLALGTNGWFQRRLQLRRQDQRRRLRDHRLSNIGIQAAPLLDAEASRDGHAFAASSRANRGPQRSRCSAFLLFAPPSKVRKTLFRTRHGTTDRFGKTGLKVSVIGYGRLRRWAMSSAPADF